MAKAKPKTSTERTDSTPVSAPKKPAVPTITIVSVKRPAQPTKAKVFIHEAKPTLH